MFVLTRKRDESIMIGDDIRVTIVEVRGDQVKIGIDAPRSIPVHREEVYREILAENRRAALSADVDVTRLGGIVSQRDDGGQPVSPRIFRLEAHLAARRETHRETHDHFSTVLLWCFDIFRLRLELT